MKSTSAKILTAFLVGTAVGVAAGILFAPEKGEETRKKIKEKFDDLSDIAQEKVRKAKDMFNPSKEEA